MKPGWRSRSHSCVSPCRHDSQLPQPQQNGTVTRSPTAKPRTSGPTSATTPASSCPGTCGRAIDGSCPIQPCQSRPAHAGRPHLDDDAVGLRRRVRDRLQRQGLLEGVHHGGAHVPYCRGVPGSDPLSLAPEELRRLGYHVSTASSSTGRRSTAAADRRGRPRLVGRPHPALPGRAERPAGGDRLPVRRGPAARAARRPPALLRPHRQPEQPALRARRPDRRRRTTRSPAAGPAAPARRPSSSPCSTGCASWMGMPDGDRGRARQRRLGRHAHRARRGRARPRRRPRPGDRLRLRAHPRARSPRPGACSASTRRNLRVLRADPAHRLPVAAVEAARAPRPRGRPRAVRGRRHRRHDEHRRGRPAHRPRRPRRSARACGSTSTAPTARPPGSSTPRPPDRASSAPTRSCSTRTSGSSSRTRSAPCSCASRTCWSSAFALDGAYLRDTDGRRRGVPRPRAAAHARRARAEALPLAAASSASTRSRRRSRAGSRSPSTPSRSCASATAGRSSRPPRSAIVCFRRAGATTSRRTRMVRAAVADGYAAPSTTILDGRTVARLCTINPRTTERRHRAHDRAAGAPAPLRHLNAQRAAP